MVEDDRARRRHADGRGSHDRRHPVEGRVVEVVIGDDAYAVQPGPGRVKLDGTTTEVAALRALAMAEPTLPAAIGTTVAR